MRRRAALVAWPRAYFVAAAAAALLATPPASSGARVDASMLRSWTPSSSKGLASWDPVAVAYLAEGWMLADDGREAERLLRSLAGRGRLAFTAGALPSLLDASRINPANTVYTVALIQVADAFRIAGMHGPLELALGTLRRMPIVDGGCYAYSVPDARAGCIQDIGGITLAVLSHLPTWNIARFLRFETSTMRPDGSWLYWQDHPDHGVLDAPHLAWTAFMLLGSPDPQVRRLGLRAARYVAATYDPSTAPAFSIYAVAAMKIRAGMRGGCRLAAQLPAWAAAYHQANPDGSPSRKNQMWAAYVYTYASKAGCF